MNSIKIMARAKINWALDITGLAENGYHNIDTLMHRVTLFDTLTITKAQSGITVFTGHHLISDDHRNITHKAASLFFSETSINIGCSIKISKHIPVCAGMGGGSADAAATLFALDKLYETNLSQQKMDSLAVTLGADVPFMLRDGLARARGIGEKIESIACEKQYHLLGIMPAYGASTKEVFRLFDENGKCLKLKNEKMIEALNVGNFQKIKSNLGNALQPITEELIPEIKIISAQLLAEGAIATSMTGSGSLVYGLFPSYKSAQAAGNKFASYTWYRAFSTCNKGISIISSD